MVFCFECFWYNLHTDVSLGVREIKRRDFGHLRFLYFARSDRDVQINPGAVTYWFVLLPSAWCCHARSLLPPPPPARTPGMTS
jgi:hypothetical protein